MCAVQLLACIFAVHFKNTNLNRFAIQFQLCKRYFKDILRVTEENMGLQDLSE